MEVVVRIEVDHSKIWVRKSRVCMVSDIHMLKENFIRDASSHFTLDRKMPAIHTGLFSCGE